MTVSMEFARRDDCLKKLVPSELRQLVAQRDSLLEALLEAHLVMIDAISGYAGSSVCRRNQDLIDKAKGDV